MGAKIRFGPYEVAEAIAFGGMAIVYRARHAETGDEVALKTVRTIREHGLDALRRESHALTRVRHAGVVRLVNYGVEGGVPWYAMDLLRGTSLSERLAQIWDTAPPGARVAAANGRLEEVLTIARRLCQTLAFLHGEGIVHRDLKPENIVLLEGDIPVIVDFGITRRIAGAEGREALELDHGSIGTLDFMAPEQILGLDTDARTDLYALGCILFAALCGRRPFVHRSTTPVTVQHLNMPPLSPSLFVDGVSKPLENLILALLAKDPTARPGHADDVASVLDALGARSSCTLATPTARAYLYRPPFTGQERVFKTLRREVDRAREGSGHCIVVAGPSGSGKTRLVVELAAWARRAGMVVVAGECVPAAEGPDAGSNGVPLQAFRPLLQHVADRCRLEGAALTRHLFGPGCRVLEEFEPALAGIPGRDDFRAPPHIPGQDAAERAERYVAELVGRYAEIAPLMLVIDDAQWADDLTLGALAMLASDATKALRATIVITCRSESRNAAIDALRNAPGLLTLSLDPLTAEDVGRIAAGMTGINVLPARLTDFLADQSGGNPFFVAEYLKTAVAEKLLTRQNARWQLRDEAGWEPAVSLSDPVAYEKLQRLDSVETLIERRLSGLGPAPRALVEVLAVVGREWEEARAAETLALGEEAAREAVDELLLRQIVIEADGGRLKFAHDKIREAAYTAIAPHDRGELHRRVADVMEAAGVLAPSYRLLAHHYRVAGVKDKAFLYSERAARHALETGVFREASEHFASAIKLADARAADGGALALLERAKLLRSHAEVLYFLGDFETMGRSLLEAIAILRGAPLPTSRVRWAGLLTGQAIVQLGYRVLPRPIMQRLRAPVPVPALAELAASASLMPDFFLHRHQLVETLALGLLSANLATRAESPKPLSRAQGWLGMMFGVLGARRTSERYFADARDAARAANDLQVELRNAMNESFVLFLHGKFDEARACIDFVVGQSDAAGLAHMAEGATLILASVERVAGQYDEALTHSRALCTSAERLGHRLHESWGRLNWAQCQLYRGRFQEALDFMEPVEQHLRAIGDRNNRINSIALRAGALLGLGNVAEALSCADEASALLASSGAAQVPAHIFHEFVPEVYAAAWSLAKDRGEPTRHVASRAAESARAAARFARMTRIARPMALRHLARVASLRGQEDRARRLLHKSVRAAAKLNIPYEEAIANLQLALSAASSLEKHASLDLAERHFTRLGCARHLERVHQVRAT